MKFQSRRRQTPPVDETLEQYVQFCANPLRPEPVVRKEYEMLCQIEGISQIAFTPAVPHTLILGTENIVIFDHDSQNHHEVGEFLIFIRRYYANPWWDVTFRFQNVTNELYDGSGFMHPHIMHSDFDDIPARTGALCIQRGKYHIYQHIRQGEMHLVAPLLLEILHTYNPNGPYHDLRNWPVYGENQSEGMVNE